MLLWSMCVTSIDGRQVKLEGAEWVPYYEGAGIPDASTPFDDWPKKCALDDNGRPRAITGFKHELIDGLYVWNNEPNYFLSDFYCSKVVGAEVDTNQCQQITVSTSLSASRDVQAAQWADEPWVNVNDLPIGLRKCPNDMVLVAAADFTESDRSHPLDRQIAQALCCRLISNAVIDVN